MTKATASPSRSAKPARVVERVRSGKKMHDAQPLAHVAPQEQGRRSVTKTTKATNSSNTTKPNQTREPQAPQAPQANEPPNHAALLESLQPIQPSPNNDTTTDAAFLSALGRRVRELRERRGMTRKLVARDAEVSERHLAHLEAGEGNISIVLLRRIALALNVNLAELLLPEAEDTVEKRLIRRFLERLPVARMEDVVFRLMRDFGHEEAVRRKRIALVGLRGAGKTTLGQRLAADLGTRFVELDQEIEHDTGMPVEEIFALYGQAGYRRAEKRCLERVLREVERGVIAAGGGIVAQGETYEQLLANCFTVWIKAAPEAHMARVMAQGDLRPMAGNDEAMDDLRRILEAREPLYRKADATLDTGAEDATASYARLKQLLGRP